MVEIRNENDLKKLNHTNNLIQAYITRYLQYFLKEYECSDISEFGTFFFLESIEDCKRHKEMGLSLPLDKATYEFTDRLSIIGKNEKVELLHSCFVLTNDYAISVFAEPETLTAEIINNLLEDINRNGYNCIGKPEPLKGDKSGYWSVRIDEKNRLIFKIDNEIVEIMQCGTHYGDK